MVPMLVVARCPFCKHPISAVSEEACKRAIDDHCEWEDIKWGDLL